MHFALRPEARRDEHAAVWQPVEEGSLPPFRVSPDSRCEAGIDGGNTVEDQRAIDPVSGDGEGLRVRREAEL